MHAQQPRARQLSDAVDDARLRELVTPNETRSPEARTYPGPSLEIARHHQLF